VSEPDRAELERRYREACALLLASQEELSRLAQRVEDATRAAEETRADLDAARDELQQAHADLGEANRVRALREEQLADVLGSASWRLTTPLRSLKRLAGEGGG
jgi:hypothetical protein